MAKISVSIPDDLGGELRDEAAGNVSRFVSSAVRDALDHRRLLPGLEALDEEFGPVSTNLLDGAEAVFDAVDTANEKRILGREGLDSCHIVDAVVIATALRHGGGVVATGDMDDLRRLATGANVSVTGV